MLLYFVDLHSHAVLTALASLGIVLYYVVAALEKSLQVGLKEKSAKHRPAYAYIKRCSSGQHVLGQISNILRSLSRPKHSARVHYAFGI